MLLSLSLTIALMGVLTLLERRTIDIDWRERWLNLQALALAALAKLFLLPLVVLNTPVALLDGTRMPFWLAFPIFLVVMDFGEYLFHRAQHAIPALWAMHSLHHSDPEMNATTAERHFWGDQLVKAATIWPLAAIIIQPTVGIVLAYMLASLWHTVVHARLNWSFGRLSWLLNSPAYHRRHHSRDPAHFNSNYSALLPIFDVLSGAYNRPTSFPQTGLSEQPISILSLILWPLQAWRLPLRPNGDVAF
ncbi:MAG TPA: sterol desaturase family protein [Sphingomicrobium sp.]|nr:sterol desaturase family protein [Sphingomicrobium sp.]